MDTNLEAKQAGIFLRTIAITILITATTVFASCDAYLESDTTAGTIESLNVP
jgi:hypothetical protein